MQSNNGFLIILLAMFAANLPFLTNRLFGFIPYRLATKKPVGLRLVEWMVYYALVGLIAYSLEQSTGQVHEQSWAFYAITICLFAVFAYPSIVYRYLFKARGV